MPSRTYEASKQALASTPPHGSESRQRNRSNCQKQNRKIGDPDPGPGASGPVVENEAPEGLSVGVALVKIMRTFLKPRWPNWPFLQNNV